MQRICNFIWDFDGTLFDTYPVIIENLRLALNEYDCDCNPTEAMYLMLDTIAAARDYYADKFGIDRELLATAYGYYHKEAAASLRAEPFAGVQEVLEHIRATGRHSYIFTHRKYEETIAYLRKYGLDSYFQDIIGPDSPHFAWKPAPDAVLYLMEKYQMDPSRTVMIGDRDCDLGSGRNAGIQTAHLICAAAPETLVCDWRLNDFGQMLALL